MFQQPDRDRAKEVQSARPQDWYEINVPAQTIELEAAENRA